MMFWLAECAGVSQAVLDELEETAKAAALENPKDGNPHGRMIRAVLPWSDLEEAITNGPAPASDALAQAEAERAFSRLCEKRSKYRKYL